MTAGDIWAIEIFGFQRKGVFVHSVSLKILVGSGEESYMWEKLRTREEKG